MSDDISSRFSRKITVVSFILAVCVMYIHANKLVNNYVDMQSALPYVLYKILAGTYVYNAANQLIRENLYYGTGNSNNATITYEYDSWGNLLNKKIYAYTTGTLSEIYRENPSRCMCFFLIHAAKRPSAVLIHCNKLIVEASPMIDTSTQCFIPYSSRR